MSTTSDRARTRILALLACALLPAAAPTLAAADFVHDDICCEGGGCTGPDVDADPVKAAADTDAELDRTYRAVLDEYASKPGAAAAIRDAQRSWIALRDRDLEALRASWGAVLPADDPRTRRTVLYNSLVEQLNNDRSRFLCDAYLAPRG